MKEIFLIIELVSKILDLVPNSLESAKKQLKKLKEDYLHEITLPKDVRDDARIDELRDKILGMSTYALTLDTNFTDEL